MMREELGGREVERLVWAALQQTIGVRTVLDKRQLGEGQLLLKAENGKEMLENTFPSLNPMRKKRNCISINL